MRTADVVGLGHGVGLGHEQVLFVDAGHSLVLQLPVAKLDAWGYGLGDSYVRSIILETGHDLAELVVPHRVDVLLRA